jgi:uncharacterized protein
LSKEALTGSVPLRTFGQLKQLWQARVEAEEEPQVPPQQPGDAASPSQVEAAECSPQAPTPENVEAAGPQAEDPAPDSA